MQALYKKMEQITRDLAKETNTPLTQVRFGSGDRTYFTAHNLSEEFFQRTSMISYGKKCIQGLMNGKEIVRDYQRLGVKDVTVATSISLVILHEFAHAIDTLEEAKGHRKKGRRHHNPLWERDFEDLVRKHLDDIALEIAEVLGENSLETLERARPYFSGEFSHGDKVQFSHRGVQYVGTIVRKGKLRWTVKVQNSKCYVPERCLKKLA